MPLWGKTDNTAGEPKFTSHHEGMDSSNYTMYGVDTTEQGVATNANDVLKVVANPVSLNGGTIKDAGTNSASTITSSVAIGTAAGTLTVAA